MVVQQNPALDKDRLDQLLGASVLPARDISKLEAMAFDDNGEFRILPASNWWQFTTEQRQLFGHKHAMYCIPTAELIEYLDRRIGNRDALEIGAGNGIVGRALGIRMTDSHQQAMPKYKELYHMSGQPVIKYGKDVLKMDALEAVKRFKPDVVIGCWVTHLWREAEGWRGGNEVGVDETKLIKRVDEYIVVGNHKVHKDKPIMEDVENVQTPDWLVSRASAPIYNAIYTWIK